MQGVLGLMGVYDTSFSSMKTFLAKRGVTDDIIHFDARKISVDVSHFIFLNGRLQSHCIIVNVLWC